MKEMTEWDRERTDEFVNLTMVYSNHMGMTTFANYQHGRVVSFDISRTYDFNDITFDVPEDIIHKIDDPFTRIDHLAADLAEKFAQELGGTIVIVPCKNPTWGRHHATVKW